MFDCENNNLSRGQRRRLARFDVRQSVDIHCHLLPGLDDGPAAMFDAMMLCRALVDDGITTVIATPHQLGRYDGSVSCEQIRHGVSLLNAAALRENLPIRILPGADVRIDERIIDLLNRSEVMTLGDAGRYILLELPARSFINPLVLMDRLQQSGISMILTHPERCERLAKNPTAVLPWVERGLILQITASSLSGDFGSTAEEAGWYWLSVGAASLVATDAHDVTDRPPCMTQAIAAIASRLGADVAKRVCLDNPLRVLEGSEIRSALGNKVLGERL